jgi:8-oxo-dGTP pyrophosphatase MutT (NUDIX family)
MGMRQRIYQGTSYKLYYGYVGFVTDDGGVQDVYILNFDGSVPAFDGVVCAVIERKNCTRDKWVVIPEGTTAYEPDILYSIQNQEGKYSYKMHCYFEKSCGSVIYALQGGVRKYLLVENVSGHIGFPKGHIEFAESEKDTAIREVLEETNLKIVLDNDFRSEYTHTIKNGAKKTDVYFSSRVYFSKSFSYRREEILNIFLLPFDQALKKLNRPQDMIVLLEHSLRFGK